MANWSVANKDIYVTGQNILLKQAFGISSYPDVTAVKNCPVNYNEMYGVNPTYYPAPYDGHKGTDYLTPTGTPIYGLIGFKVNKINGMPAAYGKNVEIANNQIAFIVCHLDEINVKEGQAVESSMVIGRTGNTGQSQGPHLHVQTWLNEGVNNWVDSTPYMDGSKTIPGVVTVKPNPNTNQQFNYAKIPALGFTSGGEVVKTKDEAEMGQYDFTIEKVLSLFPTVADALNNTNAYSKYAGKYGYSNGVLKVNFSTLNYRGKFDTNKYRYICTDQGVVVVKNLTTNQTYGVAR